MGAPGTHALNGTQDTTVYNVPAAAFSHYFGLSVRETTGSAAASFRVREGSNSGRILDTISLLPGESRTEWYGPMGIPFTGDLVEDWVSGAYEGTVRVG